MQLRRAIIGAAAILLAGAAGLADAAPASVFDSLTITQPTGGERIGADIAIVDVTGIPSMDGLGSPNNVVIFLWIGPFNSVTGIGWDVTLQTLIPSSRRRDIAFLITNTSFEPVPNFGFQPGGGDPTPGGPTQYQREIFKLESLSLPAIQATGDGLIRLEFLEIPDNAPSVADGLWVSGQILFQTGFPIPSAPSAVLLIVPIVGERAARRRPNAPHDASMVTVRWGTQEAAHSPARLGSSDSPTGSCCY